jgi:hypothetical protein
MDIRHNRLYRSSYIYVRTDCPSHVHMDNYYAFLLLVFYYSFRGIFTYLSGIICIYTYNWMMFMYIYIYIYIYEYLYTFKFIYLYLFFLLDVIHIFRSIFTYLSGIYIYISVFIFIYMCIYEYICIWKSINCNIDTCIWNYTYMHFYYWMSVISFVAFLLIYQVLHV